VRIPLRTIQRSCTQFTGLLAQNPDELVEVVNAKGKVLFYAQYAGDIAKGGDVTGGTRSDTFNKLKEEYGDVVPVTSSDNMGPGCTPCSDWGA